MNGGDERRRRAREMNGGYELKGARVKNEVENKAVNEITLKRGRQ